MRISKSLVFSLVVSATLGAWTASASVDLFPNSDTLPILAWFSIPPGAASQERFEELKEAGFNLSSTVDHMTTRRDGIMVEYALWLTES